MRRLAALFAVLTLASAAHAAEGPTRRFAVVAGASLGGPGRTPLRYAASDARDVARVLRRLGGVALDDLVLVEEPDADRLRGALAAVAARTDAARRAGQRVELFLYYSGHSDEEALLLGGTRLPYAELRHELDGVPADVRVAILDSCASGAITRAKGGVRRPPFLLDAASRVSGHAFLTSSAADEAAQESDRLRASFFTHALVTGLRGAADTSGDGIVTLNEAYQFAFRETLAGTEASQAGPQHATYDIGLVGSGDVVMTDLRRADGILVVPEPVDGRVFVRNAAGVLVAELRKARGARIELALEEGRYDVRVVRDQQARAATITLAGSDRVVLEEGRLWPIALEPTKTRGDVAAAAPGPVAGPVATPPAGRGLGEDLPSPAPAQEPLGMGPFGEVMIMLRGGRLERARPSRAGWGGDVSLESWLPGGAFGVEFATGFHRLASGTAAFEGELSGASGPQMFYGVLTDGAIDIIPATVTVKLGLPGHAYRPYVSAGFGLAHVHAHYAPDASARSAIVSFGSSHVDASSMTVGAQAGAGMAFRLDRRVMLVLDARYTHWVPVELGYDEVAPGAFRVTAGFSVSLF